MTISQLEVGFSRRALLFMLKYQLAWSCVDNHSFYVFMSTMSLLCLEDCVSYKSHTILGSCNLSITSSERFLSHMGGGDVMSMSHLGLNLL